MYVYYRDGRIVYVRRPFSDSVDIPPHTQEVEIFNEETFEVHKETYFADQKRVNDQFKTDLYSYFELEVDEWSEKCYALACRHAGGENHKEEIFHIFKDLVELK